MAYSCNTHRTVSSEQMGFRGGVLATEQFSSCWSSLYLCVLSWNAFTQGFMRSSLELSWQLSHGMKPGRIQGITGSEGAGYSLKACLCTLHHSPLHLAPLHRHQRCIFPEAINTVSVVCTIARPSQGFRKMTLKLGREGPFQQRRMTVTHFDGKAPYVRLNSKWGKRLMGPNDSLRSN